MWGCVVGDRCLRVSVAACMMTAMAFTLAPGLLVAMPSLKDPNFFRAVVLLCEHTREGAFGIIINHTLELPVQAVCAEAGIAWTGDDTARVFCGGPVDRQRGWLLHSSEQTFEGTQVVHEGVAVTPSRDGLEAYGQDPSGLFRLVLGYAGWGPGQLDREILQGSWITAPLSADLVFGAPEAGQRGPTFAGRAEVWQRALERIGIANPTHLVDGSSHVH